MALAVVTLLGVSVPSGAQAGGYASTPSCSVTPASVAPGGTVTVVASGYQPGSTVTFHIRRAKASRAPLGRATVNAAGTATATLTIPTSLAPGTYTISCSGVDADGTAVEVASNVRVVDGTGGGGDGGGGSEPGSDDLARTGSNSGALARVAVLLVAGGAALLLFGRKRSQRGSTVG
jgi:hypothetical protein